MRGIPTVPNSHLLISAVLVLLPAQSVVLDIVDSFEVKYRSESLYEE